MTCKLCGKEFKNGDFVVSLYREIEGVHLECALKKLKEAKIHNKK